jgi:uncharacterized protein involved in outer membrane biogenesis
MSNFPAVHTRLRGLAIAFGALLVALVLFLTLFNWNYFRPTLAHLIAEKTGRPASIDGNLTVHLWSWNPGAEVDGLTLHNPRWAANDVMFHADRLSVSVSLGRLLRGQLVLPTVELIRPTIDLERDAQGRASWELASAAGKPRASSRPAKIPTIRRLLIEDGKLHVADQVRKLVLSGSLDAADEAAKDGVAGFELRCSGTLNAKPFHAQFSGGPLINLDPDRPYDLEAHLTAADITLDTHMSFPKPFDLAAYRVKFSVSGSDLANLYYLTGLALPNTPPYRLAADMQHTGTLFRIEDLSGRLGSSDLEGQVEVQTAGVRPKFGARLRSTTLDIVDVAPTLGHEDARAETLPVPAATGSALVTPAAPAAAVTPPTQGRLFPDADLQVNRVRGMDADVTYRAESVVGSKLPMKGVDFHLLLRNGVLRLDPLTFVLDAGKFSGSVVIDARRDVPESTIDMSIDGVDLSQFKGAKEKQAPMNGTLMGRLKIHGSGSSVHKLASSADGSISVALPSGEMNDALAELTGVDVMKGLELLAQKQPETEIRCGVVDFSARDGTLASKSVFIDTQNVLITGRGSVNLGAERLDLSLQGDPKKVRFFRLRSPITIHGTLLHPTVGVRADKLLEQAGAAAALGTLLTPFAAALAFIDPGLAKNKDCAAVMTEARADADDGPRTAGAPDRPAGAPDRPAVSRLSDAE